MTRVAYGVSFEIERTTWNISLKMRSSLEFRFVDKEKFGVSHSRLENSLKCLIEDKSSLQCLIEDKKKVGMSLDERIAWNVA
jgi:hypothetical protein